MTKVGLLTIHGMGETPSNYAEPFFDELHDRLGDALWNEVSEASIHYQTILQKNQSAYYRRVRSEVDWSGLRQFVLFGFSDAASLESQKTGRRSPYYRAQQIILDRFRDLHASLDEGAPVVLVAQSLGGQVISNYLWDAKFGGNPKHGVWSTRQRFGSEQQEKFCRGHGINRLYTTGCNIPIFIAGHRKQDIEPIDRLNNDFHWHNYYDKDDVLGWPLRQLNDKYARLVDDFEINSGFWAGGTPFSHTNYWRDSDFLRPLVAHIKSLLQ